MNDILDALQSSPPIALAVALLLLFLGGCCLMPQRYADKVIIGNTVYRQVQFANGKSLVISYPKDHPDKQTVVQRDFMATPMGAMEKPPRSDPFSSIHPK